MGRLHITAAVKAQYGARLAFSNTAHHALLGMLGTVELVFNIGATFTARAKGAVNYNRVKLNGESTSNKYHSLAQGLELL